MYYRPFARVIASTGRLTQSCFVLWRHLVAPQHGYSGSTISRTKEGRGLREASATLWCSTCPESEVEEWKKIFFKKALRFQSLKGEYCAFLESEYNLPLHKLTPRGYILFDNILAQVCHRFEGSFWLEEWPGLKNLWNFPSPIWFLSLHPVFQIMHT